MDGRTAVCHNKPVFWRVYKNEWPISWNYECIIFGQIIFQNFHQFKAFVGLSDYSYGPVSGHESQKKRRKKSKSLFTEITTKIEDWKLKFGIFKICHFWEFHKSRWINKRHLNFFVFALLTVYKLTGYTKSNDLKRYDRLSFSLLNRIDSNFGQLEIWV